MDIDTFVQLFDDPEKLIAFLDKSAESQILSAQSEAMPIVTLTEEVHHSLRGFGFPCGCGAWHTVHSMRFSAVHTGKVWTAECWYHPST
jgi:hypothetical protein